MQKAIRWKKNLKKWQKGGLIGCAVGILFAILMITNPGHESPGGWIVDFHSIFFALLYITFYSPKIVMWGGSVAIVVLYGGLGAILGKIQQGTNTFWKWSLTALLALFLLLFYVLHTL